MTVNISDVRDEHSLPYLVRDRDVIFNLAGQTSHLDSMNDPYTDLEINCRAQLSILEACRRDQPGCPRRLREHPPDLRPARVPAGRRASSARARGRERHQQDGGRVVPPPLRPGVRHSRLRAASDQHLRAADARQGRAPDLPRLLAPADRARARSSPSSATAAAARLQLRRRRGAGVPARRPPGTRRSARSTTSATTEVDLAARARRAPGAS